MKSCTLITQKYCRRDFSPLGSAENIWTTNLKNAVTNFVLLVVIGVLNLPLYVSALALALDVPYSMNHELIGQGATNILARACGTVSNILVFKFSDFSLMLHG